MKKSYKILEFDKVLEFLSRHAVSTLGRERCVNSELLDNTSDIREQIELTTQAKKLLTSGFVFPLEHIRDIRKNLEDLKKRIRLSEGEIFQIGENLRNYRIIRNYLEKFEKEFPELSAKNNGLFVNKELEDKIFDTFDSSLNVKENASRELSSLFHALRSTSYNIKESIARLLSNQSFVANLQDTVYTQREGRTVFQVKAECKNKVSGIVHDISASNQTYFIEPKELVELDNKIKEIEIKINVEIERVLKELSEEISQFHDQISNSLANLIDIDFIFAKAKYSIEIDGVQPNILDEKAISLKGMKNPVLMKVTKNIIENDFSINSENNCIIITGSNTGGKTVVLKTVGLCVLMSRAGLHVPCFEASIYPFKNIFADIGDEQSIAQSLSTFSSHMNNIVAILNQADSEALVLLDEISAGTDPAEGASLAQAILEFLQEKGVFCVVTTHYGELKSLAYLKKGFVNASVEFDLNTLSPTYKLLIGIPGASNAIAIAKNLGISEQIYSKARAIHHNQKDFTAGVLEGLQTTQHQLSQTTKSVLESEEKLKTMEDELQEKLTDIRKNKKKNIDIYKKKFDTAITDAREEIKQILKEVRQQKSEKIARRNLSRLASIESGARNDFSKEEENLAETYKSIDWQIVKPGDKLMLKNLNQEVELVSLPDKSGSVTIQMGLIRTVLKANKLAVFDKKLVRNPAKKTLGNNTKISLRRHEISQTLDLRGYRVDEALDSLDSYLDKASLANLSPVYVIHGHGTGALKHAVRDYASTSPYVAKYRVGESPEGGDGVIVIDVN